MAEILHNLSKTQSYTGVGHYAVNDNFEGLYSSAYQPAGSFYPSSPYGK